MTALLILLVSSQGVAVETGLSLSGESHGNVNKISINLQKKIIHIHLKIVSINNYIIVKKKNTIHIYLGTHALFVHISPFCCFVLL